MTKRCKHYKGMHSLRGECEAGRDIRKMVGGPDLGWMLKMPCVEGNVSTIVCEDRIFPTDKEIADEAQAGKERRSAIDEAIRRIKRLTNASPCWETWDVTKKQMSGTVPCTRCDGTIYYTVSAGNHLIHGKCSSGDCLNWEM